MLRSTLFRLRYLLAHVAVLVILMVATEAPSLAQATGGGQDQRNAQDDKGPSLEETGSFVVRTLDQTVARWEMSYVGRGVRGVVQVVTFYQNVAIDGCRISYDKVFGNRDGPTRVMWRSIELSNVALPIGEVTAWQGPSVAGMDETVTKPTYNLRLRFRRAISYTEQRTNNGVEQQPQQGVDTSASWQFQDEQITNRMRNALAHAVKLCGGKEDPF